MDWTETKNITVNGLELSITFVPVCHWSRRHIGDLCKRLWGGFVVKLPTGQKIFYPGDTGYCGIFKEIG
jgi:L-ascorbate metabolism protein UlaG (beta-lactamase superfamily)